jgi:thymidylate kinase
MPRRARQHVDQVIRPRSSAARLVVCDRYVDSSSLPGRRTRPRRRGVLELNLAVVGGLMPDAHVLVEIEPETAPPGRAAPATGSSATDDASGACSRRYRDARGARPERYVVVDGTRPSTSSRGDP